MSKKIIVVVGTRPEAIKMAPVVKALLSRGVFDVKVCFTGQHREIALNIFKLFNISPDVNFDLMNKASGLLGLSARLLNEYEKYFTSEKPDLVLVQGDTASATMAGLAAYYLQIPFGHVEAGLRTRNRFSPWPEEGNRAMLAPIADFHFAPTKASAQNLRDEQVPEARIYITGNTVIDALLQTAATIPDIHKNIGDKKMILITNHRRENFGDGLGNIFSAISHLAIEHPDVDFVFPIHPNPVVRDQAKETFGEKHVNIQLIEPQEYPEFVALMKKSYFVLTDSGGIQEEAPSLGKPVLVTRDTTERPEGIEAGTVRLVGVTKENIIKHCNELLTDERIYQAMSQAKNPYGDGTAAEQIATIIYDTL